MLFNRNKITYGALLKESPTQSVIASTPALIGASLDDAVRYGGELTRAALAAFDIQHDRKYVLVDSKVHMLMPGFYPAIPGWHTDGVPRGDSRSALAKSLPSLSAQEEISAAGRGTHFHMLVTGHCLTEFVHERNLDLRPLETESLYRDMTKQVNELAPATFYVQSERAVRFDWWDVHRGTVSAKHEWRFFIRVTETDLDPPKTDLRSIIRTQAQVYVPPTFGW